MDFLLSISFLSKAIVIAAIAGGAKQPKGGRDAESIKATYSSWWQLVVSGENAYNRGLIMHR
jgi:hypothetical protein